MKKCHHNPDSETVLLEDVKQWINLRYQRIWEDLLGMDPTYGRGESTLVTVDDYTTGTVTTNGTTTVTGASTVWISSMVGRKFKLTSDEEVYTIASFVSVTEITLDRAVLSDDDDELGYTIYDDEIDLPADCGEIVSLKLEKNYATLSKIGLREMRSKQAESPFDDSEVTYNDPLYYALKDDRSSIIVYPAPTRVVSIKLDYTKELTELSADSDVPIIPVETHELLITGGMADLLEYDDDIRAERKNDDFEQGLARRIRKDAWKTDFLSIKPYVHRT